MNEDPVDRHASLKANAARHRYDKHLDDAANLFDADPQAWLRLPVALQDASGMYRDWRETHRRAVAAGVIDPDNPGTAA